MPGAGALPLAMAGPAATMTVAGITAATTKSGFRVAFSQSPTLLSARHSVIEVSMLPP
jgi:hypothetical protein